MRPTCTKGLLDKTPAPVLSVIDMEAGYDKDRVRPRS